MRYPKAAALLFIGGLTCIMFYLVSLAYGATTGGHPPNTGMIIFGSGAALIIFVALVLFAYEVITSDD